MMNTVPRQVHDVNCLQIYEFISPNQRINNFRHSILKKCTEFSMRSRVGARDDRNTEGMTMRGGGGAPEVFPRPYQLSFRT